MLLIEVFDVGAVGECCGGGDEHIAVFESAVWVFADDSGEDGRVKECVVFVVVWEDEAFDYDVDCLIDVWVVVLGLDVFEVDFPEVVFVGCVFVLESVEELFSVALVVDVEDVEESCICFGFELVEFFVEFVAVGVGEVLFCVCDGLFLLFWWLFTGESEDFSAVVEDLFWFDVVCFEEL